MTTHTPNLKAEKIAGGVATDQRHDSAHKHVTGTAVYIDDMPEPAGPAAWLPGLVDRHAWPDQEDGSVGGSLRTWRCRCADGEGCSGRERHLADRPP